MHRRGRGGHPRETPLFFTNYIRLRHRRRKGVVGWGGEGGFKLARGVGGPASFTHNAPMVMGNPPYRGVEAAKWVC